MRPAELGDAGLLVDVVVAEERQAWIERRVHPEQDQADVQVGLVDRVVVHVGGQVASTADKAVRRPRP